MGALYYNRDKHINEIKLIELIVDYAEELPAG